MKSCPLRIGSLLFSHGLRNSSLYLSGTVAGGNTFGTARYCPVTGGSKPSSRESCDRILAKAPPTDAPPTIKPFRGSAPMELAFAANHFVTSQQSSVHVGKGCSGASLGHHQYRPFVVSLAPPSSVSTEPTHPLTHLYSTFPQTAPNSLANSLQFISSSVKSPNTNPPS